MDASESVNGSAEPQTPAVTQREFKDVRVSKLDDDGNATPKYNEACKLVAEYDADVSPLFFVCYRLG